jgi:antibiotic biosynthesis monooxygenase (ABM) superfamily enzyme
VVAKPSKFRMACITTVVLYVMIQTVGRVLGFYFEFLPLALRTFVILTLQVLLMTYVLVPRVTRALARWIYPRTVATHT